MDGPTLFVTQRKNQQNCGTNLDKTLSSAGEEKSLTELSARAKETMGDTARVGFVTKRVSGDTITIRFVMSHEEKRHWITRVHIDEE